MRIRFWGTRGSLAKPGPDTLQYGGNTSCVEVRASDGTILILDCGTGAQALGHSLLASGPKPLRGHLLISHTHWDHIQGLPFFAPLFVAGTEWDIYGPADLGRRLEEALAGQMEYKYFPVTLGSLSSTIRFHDLVEGVHALGGVSVTSRYMNHPSVTLGYRLEVGGRSVVYATDHEPHSLHGAGDGAATPPVHKEDLGHIQFLSDADVVIHDAQYTLEEYPAKMGWGHTPCERAVDFAVLARVRHLVLFHHDPMRTDESVSRLLELCRRRARDAGSDIEISAASEGETIELEEGPDVRPLAGDRPAPVANPGPCTVLVVDDDEGVVAAIELSLRPEGYRILTCHDGRKGLELAQAEGPDLILLDWQMPGHDGLEVCRRLRADPSFREVPIVLLTSMSSAENTAEGFAVGLTDYLTKPFTPAYLRSKVQQWLLRVGAAGPRKS